MSLEPSLIPERHRLIRHPAMENQSWPAMCGPGCRHYVVFRLDDDYYALPLAQVARAVRVVAVTPVPDEPPWILGVINVAGQVLPVIDLRQRFAHPARPLELTDRLLIIRTPRQNLALVVDEVLKVMEPAPGQLEAAALALGHSQPLRATIHEDDRLILVLDAERIAPAYEPNRSPDDTLAQSATDAWRG